MTEDISIHSYQIDASLNRSTIFCKTDLYGTEVICKIYAGDITKPTNQQNTNKLRELSNAICEYLETKRTNK